VRARLGHTARASGAALLAFALIAAYPLEFQFLGPQRVSGNFQPPDVYVSDLLAFVLPPQFVHFTGNATENGAYVGVPLVLVFVAGLIAGWRRLWIRWTGLMTIVVAALSLGPHLHIDGNVIPIPLPWTVVALLPLIGSALPARLMAIAFLGIGLVVAGASRMALSAPRRWRIATDALLSAGILAIIPALPYPSAPASAPAFFKAGGDVEKIAVGSVVLVTPFSSHVSTDAMYWQTVASYRFRMPEGDAFTPGPYLGPHPSFLQSTLDSLDAGQTVPMTPDVRTAALADLRAFGVTTVVAGPSPGESAIVSFLTDVLASPPIEDGGVEVWWSLTLH
jgi:hypothetical protein